MVRRPTVDHRHLRSGGADSRWTRSGIRAFWASMEGTEPRVLASSKWPPSSCSSPPRSISSYRLCSVDAAPWTAPARALTTPKRYIEAVYDARRAGVFRHGSTQPYRPSYPTVDGISAVHVDEALNNFSIGHFILGAIITQRSPPGRWRRFGRQSRPQIGTSTTKLLQVSTLYSHRPVEQPPSSASS